MLLALIAASRGHTVYIVNQMYMVSLMSYINPGIIFEKSITPNPYRTKFLKSYFKKKHIITSIDEESGLLDENYENFAKFRYSEETIGLTSKIFCWGNHDYSSLKNIYPDQKDKFVLTGSPRVDLWNKKFNNFYFNGKIIILSFTYVYISFHV